MRKLFCVEHFGVPATALRTIEEATDMSPDEIAQVWEKMKESPFRRVVQYELEIRQIREAAKPAGTLEELFKQQGVVQGLQIALGILDRPANVRSPLTSR